MTTQSFTKGDRVKLSAAGIAICCAVHGRRPPRHDLRGTVVSIGNPRLAVDCVRVKWDHVKTERDTIYDDFLESA